MRLAHTGRSGPQRRASNRRVCAAVGFSRETAPCAPSAWQGWHREPATRRGTLPPWVQAHVMCHCAWGEGHLVLQGLLWKAAPAGQGDALLYLLRKHHPGQHLFIRYFKWKPEKKRGRGQKGRKKKSGAFLFMSLHHIQLSFHI